MTCTFQHVAFRAQPAALRDATAVLHAYLRTGDRAPVAHRVETELARIAIVQRETRQRVDLADYARQIAARIEGRDDWPNVVSEQAAADIRSAIALTGQIEVPVVDLEIVRESLEEAPGFFSSLAISHLAVVAGELLALARGEPLYVPTIDAILPPTGRDGVVAPWDLLLHLLSGFHRVDTPAPVLDAEQMAFLAAHPDLLDPGSPACSYLVEPTAFDRVGDPALLSSVSTRLPRPFVDPSPLHSTLAANLTEDGSPLPPSRIGAGVRGGPVTWAAGDELVDWGEQRQGAFAASCVEAGRRGEAMVSFLWLHDA